VCWGDINLKIYPYTANSDSTLDLPEGGLWLLQVPPEICHKWLPDEHSFSSSEHSTSEILPIFSLTIVETGKTKENCLVMWQKEGDKTHNSVFYLHLPWRAGKF